MTNFVEKISLIFMLLFCVSCSKVLETVSLEVDKNDLLKQEDFTVIEKTLTTSEAQNANITSFSRFVSKNDFTAKPRLMSENEVEKSQFPTQKSPQQYKVGIGDQLSFNIITETSVHSYSQSVPFPETQLNVPYRLGIGDQVTLTQLNEEVILDSENIGSITSLTKFGRPTSVNNIIQTTGRIGSDGSMLLLEVGRLEALNKTINELRSEVRNILIRNGISPKFQLEISAFGSQKAYFTVSSNVSGQTLSTGKVISLTDQPLTLRGALSQLGLSLKPGVSSKVSLQRLQSTYTFEMSDVFSTTAPDIIIKDLDHIFIDELKSNTVLLEVVVAHDGNIILPDIGKLEVAGKTLKEIEKTIIERDVDNWRNFQVQVTQFKSKKAIIVLEESDKSSSSLNQIIPITSSPLALLEALTKLGISIDKKNITKVHLNRNGSIFTFLLKDLVLDSKQKIYLEDGDLIRIDRLEYKPSKVFITGSGITPIIFKISPSNRETLADVLFTSNGVLSSNSAKRSEVYLLRGRDPIIAYHLDALSPSRLIVAEAMELRPNDILFVAEQPINSFNRTLQTILPLRILLRDINDDNIP